MNSDTKIQVADLFKAEYERLKRYSRNLQHDLSDLEVEDIIQNVALNIFSKVDFQTPVENMLAHVCRSVRNRIINL